MDIIQRIEALHLPPEVPTIEIPPMHMTHERARMDYAGITHIHHFLPRAAQAMGALWAKAQAHPDPRIRSFLVFFVEQAIWTGTLLEPISTYGFLAGQPVFDRRVLVI